MSTFEISEVTGYSESTIRKIHARYFKDGKFWFKLKKIGRIRETLSLTEEKNLLAQFESIAVASKSRISSLGEVLKLSINFLQKL